MSRLSWKRRKSTMFGAPKSFELHRDGTVYAIVQEGPGGWFSYGMSGLAWNTSGSPLPFLEAKADAMRRTREAIKENRP